MNLATISRRRFAFSISATVAAMAMDRRALGANAPSMLRELASPVLFSGNAQAAFRDPAAVFSAGWIYLFFTLIRREEDGVFYSYLAWSKSRDLKKWTPVVTLTPRDKNKEYGSPGDIVRVGKEWVICLQTYPRPEGQRYGNKDARLWTMRSMNLEHWSEPELLKVKGSATPLSEMGRMIDPFLLHDKDPNGPWWCLYKQNGISLSRSPDLQTWTYIGRTDAGENPCVIVDKNEYVLFHSPKNGIGMKRSSDLQSWRDMGVTTLGQAEWDWAKGRITAGFVLDLRHDPHFRRALLFFHASRFDEEDTRGGFDNFASIGVAWSTDLKHWQWPASQ